MPPPVRRGMGDRLRRREHRWRPVTEAALARNRLSAPTRVGMGTGISVALDAGPPATSFWITGVSTSICICMGLRVAYYCKNSNRFVLTDKLGFGMVFGV